MEVHLGNIMPLPSVLSVVIDCPNIRREFPEVKQFLKIIENKCFIFHLFGIPAYHKIQNFFVTNVDDTYPFNRKHYSLAPIR